MSLGRLSATTPSLGKSSGAASANQPMSDINVTPLVDVMLVLVVIFIVTAPLLASAIRLNLPVSEAAQPLAAPNQPPVVLSIDAAGNLFLNDQPQASLQSLLEALQPIGKAQPDAELQIRADAAVPHGRVLQAIGMVQKAGLGRIGFIAQPTGADTAAAAAPAAPTPAPAKSP